MEDVQMYMLDSSLTEEEEEEEEEEIVDRHGIHPTRVEHQARYAIPDDDLIEETEHFVNNLKLHVAQKEQHIPRALNPRKDTKYDRYNFPLAKLPFNVQCSILSKVPIKPLVRFMCLSKYWYGLKQDPRFINYHLNHGQHRPPGYILAETFRFRSFNPLESLFLVEEGKVNWTTDGISVKEKLEGMQIVGSCNGFLCLLCVDSRKSGPIVVYNPITQESMSFKFPDALKTISVDEFSKHGSILLGFDERSNMYKIVLIYRSEAYVTTLGEYSWRNFNLPGEFQFMHYLREYRESVLFNGVSYWVINKKIGTVAVKKILAMDICSEKFEEIDFSDPWIKQDPRYTHYYLVNLNKSLAMVLYNSRSQQMQIWQLVKDGWTYQSSHDMLSFYEEKKRKNFTQVHCRVEGIVGDDGLMMAYFNDSESAERNILIGKEGPKYHLVGYNPKKGKFDFKGLHLKQYYYYPRNYARGGDFYLRAAYWSWKFPKEFDVVPFVPSFASLNI